MLDVAAVAIILPGSGNCGLDRRQLGLLVALHDIGKLMPAFQAKVAKCWPEAVLGPFRGEHVQCPHDAAGLALVFPATRGDEPTGASVTVRLPKCSPHTHARMNQTTPAHPRPGDAFPIHVGMSRARRPFLKLRCCGSMRWRMPKGALRTG
ncbi:HD domain-containing protein [Gluconacetobacter azotocaptans]|uniref:HD domain-containing protein n=1 Tax=Gluconacetobacter azotocaptans TaxID=142834 RepID=UPI001F04488A|nr:HD domain-containing protein [Gluconacetobacter azotocaptans]